ncbi:MAG TPA: YetF domain-containing protein [Terriglobales bacterium]|nr:YetF domain-containing protein [Terriglobales bacterium]
MFLPHPVIMLGQIVIRTGLIYALVLLGVRLAGKREVGQMTPFDLTLLLLLSNSVQNAMTGPDTSLAGGAVAAITLFVMNHFVANLSGMNRNFRKFIQGQPAMLIHDGTVIESHMAKEHVSMDELERALREHSIASPKEVAIGVLEVDGSMSFLKYDDVKPEALPRRRVRFLNRKQ